MISLYFDKENRDKIRREKSSLEPNHFFICIQFASTERSQRDTSNTILKGGI